MKKLLNQKWILPAFLIAALGSQYYYSVSSQQIMSSDFSSVRADLGPNAIHGLSSNPDASTTTPTGTTVVAPVHVEGASPEVQCPGGCHTIVLDDAQYRTMTTAIAELRAIKEAQAREAAAAAATPERPETPEGICADERSQAAKSTCIRRERTRLREESEAAAREECNEEFKDKMADAARRNPNDLDTLNSKFQSLISYYSGRRISTNSTRTDLRCSDVRKVDAAVVNQVFRERIQPLLRQRLNSADQSPESLQALQEMILNMSNALPNEFRGINTLIANDIKRAAEVRAANVRSTLVEARQAYNDRDYIQSQQLSQQAEADRRRLLTEFNGSPRDGITGYYDILNNNLSGVDNQSNANLIPPVRNLFNTMNSESSNWLNINMNGRDANGNLVNSNGGRSGRGTVAAPNTNITTNSNVGPSLPNSGNMSIGSPTTQQGTRGPRN